MARQKKRKELTLSVDIFIKRIAQFEYRGQHREAATLRELANWFTPPYRIVEADVQAQIEELRRYASKPPLMD